MYDDQVYCEKIFGTIENTEWVLIWFYKVPDWYSTFENYYKQGWITEEEYINVLEFGINHAFEYSWQKEHSLANNYTPFNDNDTEFNRKVYYMNHWEEIIQSEHFDQLWRVKI